MGRRWVFIASFFLLLLFPLGVMGYKLYGLNYPMAGLIPAVSYHVDLSMQVDGHGEDIFVTTYLPKTDAHQIISDEQNSSGVFATAIQTEGENRVAAWKAENVRGQHAILYSFQIQANHVRYRIPEDMDIPKSYPSEFAEHLKSTAGIQVNDPLIIRELRTIVTEEDPKLLAALTRIHRHLQDDFKNRDFSGYTDAVTALKLGEASCNGKSRLFAAMARKLNIPARLAGGLILKQGSKRVTHQWVEVYVNGHWVPFDTINDKFAELPGRYLTLYIGDLVLFKHTANVNFQYVYKMTRRMVPRRAGEHGRIAPERDQFLPRLRAGRHLPEPAQDHPDASPGRAGHGDLPERDRGPDFRDVPARPDCGGRAGDRPFLGRRRVRLHHPCFVRRTEGAGLDAAPALSQDGDHVHHRGDNTPDADHRRGPLRSVRACPYHAVSHRDPGHHGGALCPDRDGAGVPQGGDDTRRHDPGGVGMLSGDGLSFSSEPRPGVSRTAPCRHRPQHLAREVDGYTDAGVHPVQTADLW